MRNIFRLFFRAEGANPWSVLLALLLATVAQGVGLLSLLPLLSVVAEGTETTHSVVYKIVDHGLAALGLEPSLETLLPIVVGAVIVRALLTLLAMRHVGNSVAEVSTRLRQRLLRALLQVHWSFLARQPVGRIANAMSNDATRAGQAYLVTAQFVTSLIETTVYAVVALLVSWQLALASLALGLAIALSLRWLVRMAKRAGRRQTERTSQLVTYLSDALNNVKPLKAMAREASFADLFDRKVISLRKALRRQVWTTESLASLEDILIAIFLGIGFFLAIAVWKLPVLEVLVLGGVMIKTVNSIGKVQRQYQRAMIFESPYFATLALIDETQNEVESWSETGRPSLEQGIRFDRVDFAHGPTPILKRADFEIPARGLTVITGLSGMGKTTITDLILGLYTADRGTVLIDGQDLRSLDLRAWRAMIGYVPQELALLNDTVFANVALGDPRFGEAEVRAALATAGALGFVEALPGDLDSPVGERGVKLSGGQRQRIALARALVHRPKLLILDEVTSALDPESEAKLIANIETLADRLAILAISHRSAFLGIADRVYHLADGCLEDWSHAARRDPLELSLPRRA